MRRRWHIVEEGATLTVSRAWPPRFDLVVEARFPDVRRLRLAHQIRQDMWRTLRDLRGFRPVVAITRDGDGVTVRAGGAVCAPVPATAHDRLARLLADPARRRRWLTHAERRS